MTTGGVATAKRPERAYRHEAFFYAGQDEFVSVAVAFVRDGVLHDEPTLVVLDSHKIDRLRGALGDDASKVTFADMAQVGHNPARLIPAWHDFIDRHAERHAALRGIGEPVDPQRRGAELAECQRHESLLNLAFPEFLDLWLLCPYDTRSLAPEVVDEARRSHRVILEQGRRHDSTPYCDERSVPCPRGEPLPPPPGGAAEMMFDTESLLDMRTLVADHAARAGFDRDQVADVVLSVNEIAANSILYAGGWGILRIWRDGDVLLCEVRDGGTITDPLVGRMPPGTSPESSRGLWVVNQLCDLVQVRSSEAGTVVRMHIAVR